MTSKPLIVTVTLNAGIDKTYTIENFALERSDHRVYKPSRAKTIAGGKGINVARVLRSLGRDVLATGFVGGFNGDFIVSDLDAEGIKHNFARTRCESRVVITIVDPATGMTTDVNELGGAVQPDEVEAFKSVIRNLIPKASWLVISGSAALGIPPDLGTWLIETANASGVRSALDSSGDTFRTGVAAAPYLVKPNVAELSAYAGTQLNTAEQILEAARGLTARGVNVVVVSMGASGAIATDGNRAWHAKPPRIDLVSPVGSGDALIAALIHELIRTGDIPDSLKYGVAAGTASATQCGAGLCTPDSIASVLPHTTLEQLQH